MKSGRWPKRRPGCSGWFRISAPGSFRVEIDLTQLDALADFHRRLSLEKPEIRWLINNAGIGKFGPFEKLEALEAARIVDLNCRAVVEMTWNCLPYMPAGSPDPQHGFASCLSAAAVF